MLRFENGRSIDISLSVRDAPRGDVMSWFSKCSLSSVASLAQVSTGLL